MIEKWAEHLAMGRGGIDQTRNLQHVKDCLRIRQLPEFIKQGMRCLAIQPTPSSQRLQ